MKALTLDELCDRIKGAKDPLILMHCRPDGDTVGSAAALVHIFRLLGKDAHFLSPDPIPKRLLPLLAGIPLAPPEPKTSATVITVDVASRGQLGALRELFTGELSPAFMIDHHERGEQYADYYTRPEAAATGEILFDITERLCARGDIPSPSRELVNAIFAAISSDTGCFKYSNTTAHTHLAAARLLEYGADAGNINHLLFDVKSAEMIRAEGYVQGNIRLHDTGRIAYVTIPRAVRDALGLRDEHFETAIDIVRQLEGVEVAIAVKESPDGRFKVSLRSLTLDVAEIAAALGGGGHVRAAGCSLAAKDAEEAARLVVERVSEALKHLG